MRKKHNVLLICVCLLVAAGAVPASHAAAELPGLLVPAYFPPDCMESSIGGPWAAMAQGGSKVMAILNPDSGPDYTKKDMSIFCVPQLFAAGVQTIGYVATGYTNRSLAEVYQDVDTYFDQFDAGATVINYYSAVTTHIRSKFGASSVIVANSGGRYPPQYLGQADIVVGFEDLNSRWLLGSYHGICPQPSFLQKQGELGLCQPSAVNGSQLAWSPGQTEIAAVVLCASGTVWETYARQAVAAGYQWIYVTDQGCNDNPFSALPTYWEQLLAFAQS